MTKEGVSETRNGGSDWSLGSPPLKSGGPVTQPTRVAPTRAPFPQEPGRSGVLPLCALRPSFYWVGLTREMSCLGPFARLGRVVSAYALPSRTIARRS